MEETEDTGTEPLDLRCAEQTELLSLIISGDEEATREDSDLGGKLLLLSVFPTAQCYTVTECDCQGTSIVRQSVNPHQGQCHGAAWPLCLRLL